MDTLNDYYPLYPPNPEKEHLNNEDLEETNNYIDHMNGLKRKRQFCFDDWNLKYSDDLWYLWCMINEFTDTSSLNLLDTLSFANFCTLCFENSSKY